MGTKQSPDKFDPKDLPADEPFFTLRAQDALAADIVLEWADRAEANSAPAKKVEAARDCAQRMRAWHTQKIPD
jgi:hypothetical protein